MAKFTRCDIVRLKSDGPNMTVQRVIGEPSDGLAELDRDAEATMQGFRDGDVFCQWFDGNKLSSAAFSTASLEKVECASSEHATE